MGRESFLVSGKWEQDGWPNIDTVEVTFSHHFKTTIIELPKSGLDWLYIRDQICKITRSMTDQFISYRAKRIFRDGRSLFRLLANGRESLRAIFQ